VTHILLWLGSHWLWLAGAALVALCFAIPGTWSFLTATKLGRTLFLTVALLAVGYWQRTDGHSDGWNERDAIANREKSDWQTAAALQVADATLAESEANRQVEHERADSVNRIADAYERGKNDAIALEARTVADLRAGTLRLREQWRGCEARSGAAAAAADPGVADAANRLREAGAGRVVRIVAACQAERDALLNIAEGDRRGP
jgi:hypothetical protein